MKKVTLKTSSPYEVVIYKDALDKAGEEIAKVHKKGKCVIVSDDTVWALYGDKVKNSISKAGFEPSEFIFPHGEESKNIDTAIDITKAFAAASLTRTDFAVALGGGVVGDICGFASSIYLRGIDFIQIPTTLLAAIDSSVGGKTGVNSDIGKNLIGAFHQPKRVICDTTSFFTLPEDIYSAGICEAIKYGVICDKLLFERIAGGEPDIEALVYDCVSIKRDIVESDELDHGNRQFLNLGHTLGHAVEACSDYKISHGHAVGIGMILIAKACEKLSLCENGTYDAILKAVKAQNVSVNIDFNAEELYNTAMSDKKRTGNDITLVIPKYIGKCELYKIPTSELLSFIKLALEEK